VKVRVVSYKGREEMFTLFARTMDCYARVIRAKMADEGGDTPRRASALRKEPNS